MFEGTRAVVLRFITLKLFTIFQIIVSQMSPSEVFMQFALLLKCALNT